MSEVIIRSVNEDETRMIEYRYKRIKNALYEIAKSYMDKTLEMDSLHGQYSIERNLEASKFFAVYEVIEAAGLEKDYAEWQDKQRNEVKESND